MNLNFTLVLQIISFLTLLGLLSKVLYGPFTKYLDDRAKAITDMTKNAEDAQEKARQYADDTHKALELAKGEALTIRQESKRLSDLERRKILDEAKKEATFLIDNAHSQSEKDRKQIVKELRSEIASISVDIATRVLGREINKKDHERLIEDSITEAEDALSRS
ncbi:F0F1 ATP synthase subunit B [Candidatus Omnitrophota bacterium]